MSDPRFARGAAGAFFRRADTRRDERASEAPRPLEDFLRTLAGWLPPASESSAAIRRLHTSVGAAALELQNMADEAVCCRFQSEIRSLRVGHSLSRDLQHLPSVLACVGEACRRRLAVVPHPVQLAGARAILGGRLDRKSVV